MVTRYEHVHFKMKAQVTVVYLEHHLTLQNRIGTLDNSRSRKESCDVLIYKDSENIDMQHNCKITDITLLPRIETLVISNFPKYNKMSDTDIKVGSGCGWSLRLIVPDFC